MAASASRWLTSPSEAAPKITRELSCPVLPKGRVCMAIRRCYVVASAASMYARQAACISAAPNPSCSTTCVASPSITAA